MNDVNTFPVMLGSLEFIDIFKKYSSYITENTSYLHLGSQYILKIECSNMMM
jgi:hypothetical protein